ncbi:hypothetical protein GGR51DRAFT_183558 [Nemania sp. FL0031]|nr:hypothetical protein GGR51DRAFT_183558 [Nemania sp. FL0031]
MAYVVMASALSHHKLGIYRYQSQAAPRLQVVGSSLDGLERIATPFLVVQPSNSSCRSPRSINHGSAEFCLVCSHSQFRTSLTLCSKMDAPKYLAQHAQHPRSNSKPSGLSSRAVGSASQVKPDSPPAQPVPHRSIDRQAWVVLARLGNECWVMPPESHPHSVPTWQINLSSSILVSRRVYYLRGAAVLVSNGNGPPNPDLDGLRLPLFEATLIDILAPCFCSG